MEYLEYLKSVELIATMGAVFIGAIGVGVETWDRLKTHKSAMRWAIATIATIGALAVFIIGIVSAGYIYSKVFEKEKNEETVDPTRDVIRELSECQYVLGEWPCKDRVRQSIPHETLHIVVRRNYQVTDSDISRYVDAVCRANYKELKAQFDALVPVDQQVNWAMDPCNFLKHGNWLIIPAVPF